MKMGKIRNYIQLRLINIALLISALIADYLFCSILDKRFELCLIFGLFALSIFFTSYCMIFCYLNILFSNLFTLLIFFISRMFFKNSFFKEDLIYLFIFTLIIFIISLPIKNKIKYTETTCIVFDFIILFIGISFYIGLSLYTKFRLLKFYRFYSILFIQSFLVYPIIFILKKISLKCSKI